MARLLRVAVYGCDFALLLAALTLATARLGRPIVTVLAAQAMAVLAVCAVMVGVAKWVL